MHTMNDEPRSNARLTMTDKPLRSFSAWTCLLVPLLVGIVADVYTKYASFDALVISRQMVNGRTVLDSRTHELLPGFLHLHAHVNYGAVFGLGQGQRPLFLIVSALAIALLGVLFAHSQRQRFYQILLGTLFAGVLGNLYDRIVYGHVRDMIYIFPKWGIFPWIFNIADMMLCVGVAGMFVYSLINRPAEMSTGFEPGIKGAGRAE
jgi:lipoprotein signal peptidase